MIGRETLRENPSPMISAPTSAINPGDTSFRAPLTIARNFVVATDARRVDVAPRVHLVVAPTRSVASTSQRRARLDHLGARGVV
jgi:hypothetical protein